MVHNRHTTTLAALVLFFYTIIIIMYHYCLLEKGLTPLFQSSFCPIELELPSMLFFLQLGKKLLPIGWKLVYLVEKMGKISVTYQSLAHVTLAIHILTLNLRGLSHQRFLFHSSYMTVSDQMAALSHTRSIQGPRLTRQLPSLCQRIRNFPLRNGTFSHMPLAKAISNSMGAEKCNFTKCLKAKKLYLVNIPADYHGVTCIDPGV